LASHQATTTDADETNPKRILCMLAEIVRGSVIRGRHKRANSGKDAPWYYTSGRRSSFDAARFFTHHGTGDNLVALVINGHVTEGDLQQFLDRTPLIECNTARVENALRRLRNEASRKATEAAGYSGGNGTTGELSAIIAAATANGTSAPARGRRRLVQSDR
jgi:hypothetical protein